MMKRPMKTTRTALLLLPPLLVQWMTPTMRTSTLQTRTIPRSLHRPRRRRLQPPGRKTGAFLLSTQFCLDQHLLLRRRRQLLPLRRRSRHEHRSSSSSSSDPLPPPLRYHHLRRRRRRHNNSSSGRLRSTAATTTARLTSCSCLRLPPRWGRDLRSQKRRRRRRSRSTRA